MTDSQKSKEKEALTIQTRSQTLQIVDQETLDEANEKTIRIKIMIQEVDKTFKPIYAKQKEALKEVKDRWGAIRNPLTEAEKTFKSNIIIFSREQEEKRRQAHLELEKKKRAAEAERVKEEARLEEERKEKAREALKNGDMEKYDEIVTAPKEEIETTPVPDESFIPPPVALSTGSSIKKHWKFEILEPEKIPNQFKSIDEVKIGQYVRAMKENASIPGVRIYSEDSMSMRTGQ